MMFQFWFIRAMKLSNGWQLMLFSLSSQPHKNSIIAWMYVAMKWQQVCKHAIKIVAGRKKKLRNIKINC